MRLILLRKPGNLETQEINCNMKEVRWQVSNFSNDFCCSKTIYNFLFTDNPKQSATNNHAECEEVF